MRLQDAAADHQAQAGAARLRREKGVKRAAERLGRETGALVVNAHLHLPPACPKVHAYAPAIGHQMRRILHHVGASLFQEVRVESKAQRRTRLHLANNAFQRELCTDVLHGGAGETAH